MRNKDEQNIWRKSTQQKKLPQPWNVGRIGEAKRWKLKRKMGARKYHLWSAFPPFSHLDPPPPYFFFQDYKYLITLLPYLPILFFETFICWVSPPRTIFHLNTWGLLLRIYFGAIHRVQKGKELLLVCELIFFLSLLLRRFCGLLLCASRHLLLEHGIAS